MKYTSKLRVTCVSVGICLFLLVALASTTAARNWTKPSPTQPTARMTAKNASAKISEATTKQVIEAYGRLPLSFEANKGQTDGQVKFLSRGSGYTLFLTSNEAVLALRKPQGKRSAHRPAAKPEMTAKTHTTVLRMKLVDANPAPRVIGLEELSGKSNYFIGNDPQKWHTNVPTYTKVQYKDVYPSIDLIYYGKQGKLEYDFVVAPGADPRAIRLGFQNADKLEMDAQGNLILHTAGGKVIQHAPIIYQEINGVKQTVAGNYVLQGKDEVGFQVVAYDASKPLIIDPVLTYTIFLAGSGDDLGFGIAVDAAGSAYVTGFTRSADFPTSSPLQATLNGSEDVIVAKLNADGSALLYSTYLGGSGADDGAGIAVDANGNAYVTGGTQSSNFPTVSPAQATFGGVFDAFVAKLNVSGSALLYSTFLGGNDDIETGLGIAVDINDNAYVTGFTQSSNFPTVSPVQATFGGVADAFVTKLNASGSAFIYSTYLGGSVSDQGRGIAVDVNDNAYVTGFTQSSNFPTVSPEQATSGGNFDAFVTKLNASGSAFVYSTYLGGGGPDQGFGIAVDANGSAYVTGFTTSADFPTASPFQATLNGSSDAFVTKLNASGSSILYSTYLGGNNGEQGRGIAVDANANAYVTGFTQSSNFPTEDAFQTAFGGGGFDSFVTKLNASGSSLVFSTYLGGGGFDQSLGIAVDAGGDAYVTGFTHSFTFPTATGPGGGFGAFVVKLGPADSDGDGIFDAVDTNPNTFSNDFSDVGLGGATTGTITTPGEQILTVRDEPLSFNQVTSVIPIGVSGPRGMESGAMPVGVRVYAAGAQSDDVVVIDPATSGIVARVPTGAGSFPWRVRLNPDGTELYVSLRDFDEVLVVDTVTNLEIGRIPGLNQPAQIAFSQSTPTAFVVNRNAGTVAVVDTNTRQILEEIVVDDVGRPSTLALTPDGQFLYVPITSQDLIRKISVATRSVVQTIPVGEGPRGIVITPDGNFAYVGHKREATVQVLDLSTDTIVQTIASPFIDTPQGIAITPDGTHVYVANVASEGNPSFTCCPAENVTVIRTADNTVVAVVEVSPPLGTAFGPWDVTTLPDGKKAYTNDGFSGESVFEIDTDPLDAGVRIIADSSGGAVAASVSACDGTVTLSFDAGDEAAVTCGSVTIEVISGIVEITLVDPEGNTAAVSLTEDNSITFEPETFSIIAPSTNTDPVDITFEASDDTQVTTTLNADNGISLDTTTLTFTAPSTNTDPVVVLVGGGEITLDPGETLVVVTIDIKPGSFPNSINLGSHGSVPVAIFSTTTFDASSVDPTTVTLASAPAKLKGKGTPMASFEDVDGDGLLDLVVHVETEALELSQTDEEALLEGETTDGIPIRGVDTVRVVP